MTLIEVVGGLGLLATLLVAILLAKGRYTRQSATADRRLSALAAADALLTAWHQAPTSLPPAGAGVVPGEQGFFWRTQRVGNPVIDEMGAQVIRLEIVDDRAQTAADRVLTSVEFVVDAEAPKRRLASPDRANRGNHQSIGSKKKETR